MAFEYHYRRLVHWQDTDAAGIIHFTNYFRYMEEAETLFHRSMELAAFDAWRTEGIDWPRVSVSCDFLKPVTFGDELDVHLWVAKKGRSSIGYEFSFKHKGGEVARGRLTMVFVKKDAEGRMGSVPIPAALDKRLEVAPFAKQGEKVDAPKS
jgi:YbgC/YbaW family acyl-CoA thioester hydrolase